MEQNLHKTNGIMKWDTGCLSVGCVKLDYRGALIPASWTVAHHKHCDIATFMGMMKRSFWVFSAVGFNLWRFIRVHGATFAAFIATLQCLLMGPLVNEMLCLRDDLYTWEINHCLSVEQYTSVYSVEVVMYCLFNVRLKRHKHPKSVDGKNDAVGTPGSLKSTLNCVYNPLYLNNLT